VISVDDSGTGNGSVGGGNLVFETIPAVKNNSVGMIPAFGQLAALNRLPDASAEIVESRPVVSPIVKTPVANVSPITVQTAPAAPLTHINTDVLAQFGVPIRPHTQEQVVRALRTGKFSVTDGPAIRIAIDMNGNGKIDDTDIQMGDVHSFVKEFSIPKLGGQTITLLTECISTPEFGPISKIDLYVGAQPGSNPPVGREARVYAPANHGARDSSRDPGSNLVETYVSGGKVFSKMEDGYWLDQRLTKTPTPGSQYSFTAVTVLDLNSYQAGRGITADRFFVRAFAETGANLAAQEPPRYAFSNPIWIIRQSLTTGTNTGALASLSGEPGVAPNIVVTQNAQGQVTLIFDGVLQYAPRLGDEYQDVPAAISPFVVTEEAAAGFFRAR